MNTLNEYRADPLNCIAAVFNQHQIEFVTIGRWALQAQGLHIPPTTKDIDITLKPSKHNIHKTKAALTELSAKQYDHTNQKIVSPQPSLTNLLTPKSGSAKWALHMICEYGYIDLNYGSQVLGRHEDILKTAQPVNIATTANDIPILCAPVDCIIEAKRIVNRKQDRDYIKKAENIGLLPAGTSDRTVSPELPDEHAEHYSMWVYSPAGQEYRIYSSGIRGVRARIQTLDKSGTYVLEVADCVFFECSPMNGHPSTCGGHYVSYRNEVAALCLRLLVEALSNGWIPEVDSKWASGDRKVMFVSKKCLSNANFTD